MPSPLKPPTRSPQPYGVFSIIIDLVKAIIAYYLQPPLQSFAKRAVLHLFARIRVGQLIIISPNGVTLSFGSAPAVLPPNDLKQSLKSGSAPRAVLTINDNWAWVRLLLFHDLGLAEAYMAGEIDFDDLTAFLELMSMNYRYLLESPPFPANIIRSAFKHLASNTIARALANVSVHYDISNDMFKSFLSSDMMYSCAIWGEEEGGLDGDLKDPSLAVPGNDLLEAAQMRKVRLTIEKCDVQKGDHLLDIGGGWGTLAIEAVKTKGCTAEAITLSIEQKHLADARIKEAGLEDSIKVHLMDYRNMPPSWENRFDRIISIGMIEHVGEEYLQQFWEIVDWALKDDSGRVVTQCCTTPEIRCGRYMSNSVGFIRKYIFPGSFMPSFTMLADSLFAATHGRLAIDRVDNIGPNYARTLRCWCRRFEAAFDSAIVPALKREHPELSGPHEVESFRRKWRYYFLICDIASRRQYVSNHVLVMRRDTN